LAIVLRHSTGGGSQGTTSNKFGDIQLDSDIACETIINEELKNSGVVAYALSEETPEVTNLLKLQLIQVGREDAPFIVTFDPLDGSSIIGSNFSVGTIVGIWKNDERKLIGHSGRD
jgi:sedoheptulose-bisphosphatase